MTTPTPAEAPESADRAPFTITDADEFASKVLELHERISTLRTMTDTCRREAARLADQADSFRRELREAERDLHNLVGIEW